MVTNTTVNRLARRLRKDNRNKSRQEQISWPQAKKLATERLLERANT